MVFFFFFFFLLKENFVLYTKNNKHLISQWVRWHPRGHLVLAGSEDSTAWMWNADRGVYLNIFSGHGASVTCGDFTPDGIELIFFCFLLSHVINHQILNIILEKLLVERKGIQ